MSLMTVALLWPSYFDRKGSTRRTRGDIIRMTLAYFIPSAKVRTKFGLQPPARDSNHILRFSSYPDHGGFL